MSRLADGLVAKELICRRSCDKDRRHVRLSITESGELALMEARAIAQAHVAKVLRQLTHEQKATIDSIAACLILRDYLDRTRET